MTISARHLMLKLVQNYVIAMFIGTFILEMNNLLVLNISWRDLWPYNLLGVVLGDICILCLLTAVTAWMLRDLFHDRTEPSHNRLRAGIIRRLHQFPSRIFAGMIVLSMVFSLVFHFGALVYDGTSLAALNRADGIELLQLFSFEQSLSLILAVFLYVTTRRTLRPYLLQLSDTTLEGLRPVSFLRPLLIGFISGMLIILLSLIQLISNEDADGHPIHAAGWWAEPFYFLFAFGLMVILAVDLKQELVILSSKLRSLLSVESDQPVHAALVPIISNDEIGQLAAAYNQLRTRMVKEYTELEQDQQLMREVKQKILPPPLQTLQGYRIQYVDADNHDGKICYDTEILPDGRLAILYAEVSGEGLPAALVVSGILFVFRDEIQYGREPEDCLAHIRSALADLMQPRDAVRMGLLITGDRPSEFRFFGDDMDLICDGSLQMGKVKVERISHEQITVHPLYGICFQRDDSVKQ